MLLEWIIEGTMICRGYYYSYNPKTLLKHSLPFLCLLLNTPSTVGCLSECYERVLVGLVGMVDDSYIVIELIVLTV